MPFHLDPVLTGPFFCLMLELTLDFFLFSRTGALDFLGVDFTAAHLPLHELAESTVRIGRKFLIGAFLGDFAISIDADDTVGTLDGRQTVSDADRGVVLG